MSRPAYIIVDSGLRGTVKWFSLQKGYGFIQPEDDGDDVFLHLSHVLGDYSPQKGDAVEYSTANDQRRNRVYAVEVSRA